DADQLGGERERQHHDQDGGDDRYLDGHVVVDPDDQPRHQPPADGQAEGEEQEGAGDARADRLEVDRAGGGDARDHRDDDPGHGVVEDRRGEDELADVAADDADLHQRHGD